METNTIHKNILENNETILLKDIFYQYFLKYENLKFWYSFKDIEIYMPRILQLNYCYKYIITNKKVIELGNYNINKQIVFKAKLFYKYLKCIYTNNECFCGLSQLKINFKNKCIN